MFQSPIVTPIKSKLFGGKTTDSGGMDTNNQTTPNMAIHDDSMTQSNQHQFKTPKQNQMGSLMSKALINSTTVAAGKSALPGSGNTLLQQQHEYKSLVDATGSRFSVRLNDNRLVRVNLTESSTCKIVNMCLEGFKYSLSKEIYYDIVQQWYLMFLNPNNIIFKTSGQIRLK
jgi:hypothetical protein